MNSIYNDAISTNSVIKQELQSVFETLTNLKEYKKDQIIYYQGDIANCFYYLKQGRASVFMISPEGMEKTLNTTGSGEILGEAAFFDRMPRVSSAKALTDCKIVSIDNDKLMDLIQKNPSLAVELLKIQAVRIRLLSSQIDSMAFLQADARIARILLEYQSTKNNVKTVKLTHEEIGKIAGVSRVTVSKILNSFSKSKIVKTKYGKIELCNIEKLKSISFE